MLGILLLKAKRDRSAKCLVKLACPNKQNSEQFELKQNTKKFFFFSYKIELVASYLECNLCGGVESFLLRLHFENCR